MKTLKSQYKFSSNRRVYAKKIYRLESLDLHNYTSKDKVHALVFGDSYYENKALLKSQKNFCFICNLLLIKQNTLPNDPLNNIYYHCSDCKTMVCDVCTSNISQNFGQNQLSYKFCDCYLFKKDHGCDKFLCVRCSFSVDSIIVNHGFGCDSHSSLFMNSNYSYKCFYELLKILFFNSRFDKGFCNSVIRIVNDFVEIDKISNNNNMLIGIKEYIRNRKYSQTFVMIIFELAKNDLIKFKLK